jgi:hypothetical protein
MTPGRDAFDGLPVHHRAALRVTVQSPPAIARLTHSASVNRIAPVAITAQCHNVFHQPLDLQPRNIVHECGEEDSVVCVERHMMAIEPRVAVAEIGVKNAV